MVVDRFTCVGCGYCCSIAPCTASVRLYPGAKVCPQLIWEGERYRCGLMTISGTIGPAYRLELAAGAGCCSNLNPWRKNVKKRINTKIYNKLESTLDQITQLLIRCLASQITSEDQMYLLFSEFEVRLNKSGYNEEHIFRIIKDAKRTFNENKSNKFKSFI